MPGFESIEKSARLKLLWEKEIGPKERHPQQRWWTFPGQGAVMGFFGVRGLMMVGDQPSTAPWPETHPSRILLYETLVKLGVPDAHLTDVIKRRGTRSESRKALPEDFRLHIEILRREIEIVRPDRIVALGRLAEQLLLEHVPEVRKDVRWAWHFAYGTRPGKADGFEASLRAAIL